MAKIANIRISRRTIVTKYLGASNYRGPRVKAIADAGSITLSWDFSLNSEENHNAAALTLADKLAWEGELAVGASPDNSGNVYVFVS